MSIQIVHQTKAQFRNRLRKRYRNARREDLGKIATLILAMISAGDYTDAQIQAEFGKTDPEYVTFKAKLTTQSASWLALKTAAGE